MNTLGNKLKLTSFGESHGPVIGAVLDGMPSGFKVDVSYIQRQLSRRRPGQSALTTQRNEEDEVVINAGLFEGKTTGTPIHFQLKNKDARSSDYDKLKDVYRPNHADYSYEKRYGIRDYRGGGRSSARVTAGWVAAGALVQDFLEQQGIRITAYVKQIGKAVLQAPPKSYTAKDIEANLVRCPEMETAQHMIAEIEEAKSENDSLGGVIECVVEGLTPGIGNPVFDKLNARLGFAMLSINAVKGFELGGGFEMTTKRGSEVKDEFYKEGDAVKTKANFSGGIQGGISNGQPIVFRVAFKPTATIGKEQSTIDKKGNAVLLEAIGRHDPCVVPRAVPIVETLAALVIGDYLV
jgi:chorismate synthase